MSFSKHHLRHPAIWITLGWALIAVIVYLSLARATLVLPGAHGDKYGHVAAYAAAMFWFMQIYGRRRSRLSVAIALAGLGVGLEFVQWWTGYRAFEYADMVADVAGVSIGWIVGPPRTVNVLERFESPV
jgi:hypothetical protein